MKFLFSLLKLAVIISVFSRRIEAQHIPTGDERQEVLDAHNRARSEIAAQYNVAAMPALVWSDAAAQHGLNWLNQQSCFSGGLQHSDSYAANFGENLARGQRSWTAAAYDAWFASELSCYEAVHPDWTRCSCTCGHMTAMTWEATTVVGCARCNSTNGYICNYGSSAPNFGGQDVFNANSGSPCSACPSDMSNCVDNLCTNGTGGGSPPATNPPAPTDPAPVSTDAPSTDPPVTAAPGGGGGEGSRECGPAFTGRSHQGSAISIALANDAGECCQACEDDRTCQAFHFESRTFGTFVVPLCQLYDEPYNNNGGQSGGDVYNIVTGDNGGGDGGNGGGTPDPPTPTEAPEGACRNNPCRNNAQCIEDGSNFECDCLSGWQGDICDEDIDDCEPINPCLNEGVCTDRGTNDFSCDCPEGFRGVQCESATEPPQGVCATLVGNECGVGECVVSVDSVEGWVCECQRGYENPLDANSCAAEFRGRFRFTFDQALQAADVPVFEASFSQNLAPFLGIPAGRITNVAVQYLNQPMQVDAFIVGAVDVSELTVMQIYDILRTGDTVAANPSLAQMDIFQEVLTVECIGDECPVVSDVSGPDSGSAISVESSGGMGIGTMLGVVIGVVLGVSVLVVIGLWAWKRYKNSKAEYYEDHQSMGAPTGELAKRSDNPTMFHTGSGAPAFPQQSMYSRGSGATAYGGHDGTVGGGAF